MVSDSSVLNVFVWRAFFVAKLKRERESCMFFKSPVHMISKTNLKSQRCDLFCGSVYRASENGRLQRARKNGRLPQELHCHPCVLG